MQSCIGTILCPSGALMTVFLMTSLPELQVVGTVINRIGFPYKRMCGAGLNKTEIIAEKNDGLY